MAGPPTGSVTFLFTDIEGSTALWEKNPEAMKYALARHDEVLNSAIEAQGGRVFKTMGDAFCAAFLTAPDALGAALSAQRALLVNEERDEGGGLLVRMVLHTGSAEERNGDYFGPPLNRVSRLLSAAHGGQTLLSLPAQELVRDQLPLDAELRDLGEHEYAVPPLAVPDLERLPGLEALSHYEAVRLFIERARAAKADFAVTNENATAVAEICARLDGLPFAIELAAARVKLLPPKAMLGRLGRRLKLLTGGARNLPERQRTLRGAIEWSRTLLAEGEKTLFSRMAVFSGGRTFEAVEAVCDAEGDLPVDALEGVSSLLDESLLRQEEGPQGDPRFVMLETIHEYAREKLQESGEAEEIGRAHAEYFLALAQEAEPELTGSDQVEWMERLEAEHDNMRAALSRSLEGENGELGLRLASALSHFWLVRGFWSEGRRWLEEALAGNACRHLITHLAESRSFRQMLSERVLDVMYADLGPVGEDSDHVEAQGVEGWSSGVEVVLGDGTQGALLVGGDGLERVSEAGPAPEFYLDEDDGVVLAHDQVDLPTPAPVVALEECVTPLAQVAQREVLTPGPGCLFFQPPTPA
jgi:predicted ATPase